MRSMKILGLTAASSLAILVTAACGSPSTAQTGPAPTSVPAAAPAKPAYSADQARKEMAGVNDKHGAIMQGGLRVAKAHVPSSHRKLVNWAA